jgi:thiamine pyrophosphate-dependent acetolactate synthase large subunit-like protein
MSRSDLDFVALARGIGAPCECVTTIEELNAALARRLKVCAPYLVEVMLV